MITATMAEAKTNLSKLALAANKTGEPVTVFRNSKPWIEIRPLAYRPPKKTAPPQGQPDAADPASSCVETPGEIPVWPEDPEEPIAKDISELPPETIEAIREADEIMANPDHPYYTSLEDLFADLGLR